MDQAEKTGVELGNFSVSLSVADIHKSVAFYSAFGFEQIAGNIEQNWIILKNGDAKIGLFQNMFQGNMMNFNPADGRAVEVAIKAAGHAIETETTGEDGPCHFTLKDPDGNQILVDQH